MNRRSDILSQRFEQPYERRAEGDLYRRLLGERWAALPEGLRRFHSARRLEGEFVITVGASRWARLLQYLLRLPCRGGPAAVAVEIDPEVSGERWSRRIGDWRLRTRQSAAGGLLREKVGCLEFDFELALEAGRVLTHRQVGVRLRWLGLALPLPGRLSPRVEGEEGPAGAPYVAEVSVRLAAPGGAALLAYRGFVRVGG